MATNVGLRRAYTVWATFYDAVVRFLRWSRRRSFALLDAQPGDPMLLVGCGTGSDFEFIPPGVEATGIDLTPAMLRRAAAKIRGHRIRLLEMDAMDLQFPAASFDETVLHLVLAVVPDPVRTLREAERVTRPGGLLVVLDKFWNRPAPPPLPLRIANAILGGYVTAVNRNFHAMLAQTSLEVVREVPLGFGGLYVLYLLRKPGSDPASGGSLPRSDTGSGRDSGVQCA
jgi:ubiquinone/menaquinone biosynthesis C-methylase UbiE